MTLGEYVEKDTKSYLEYCRKYAIGHLCFDCERRIENDELITIQLMGVIPVYHHTACAFGEEDVQHMKLLTERTETGRFDQHG